MFDRDAFDQDQAQNAVIDRAVQLSRTPGAPAMFQGAGRNRTMINSAPDLKTLPDPETGESMGDFTLDADVLDSNARLI